MGKPNKKQLEFTVNDLNKVLKLNPSIEKKDEKQMTTDIKEIEELLQAGDIVKLDKKSKKVMVDLGVKLPEVQAAAKKPVKKEAKAKPTKKAAKEKPEKKEAKAKPTKKAAKEKKVPKEATIYEHAGGSMSGTIDKALIKGVTMEDMITTLKDDHGRKKDKAQGKFRSHIRHLENMHGVEVGHNEKTGVYKIKKKKE